MKKIIFVSLLAVLLPKQVSAQVFLEGKDLFYQRGFFERFHSEISQNTLDKVEDYKSLVGKYICLRPDYQYDSRTSKSDFFYGLKRMPKQSNYTATSIVGKAKSSTISKNDRLKVIKYNKASAIMTVARGDEELKISGYDLDDFVLIDYIESLPKQYDDELKQSLKSNLDHYFDNLKKQTITSEGPIVVENDEVVYDATIPYWRWRKENKYKKTSIGDEKLVINKKHFQDVFKRTKHDDYGYFSNLLDKLNTVKEDTFGIFSLTEFINLRTGELYNNEDCIDLWESVRFLDLQEAIPIHKYNGEVGLKELLSDKSRVYKRRIIESLIGERVFTLDDLKYDVITSIEERDNGFDIYLENRGCLSGWENCCLLVKWYEELQKLVGKKIIWARSLPYVGALRIWYENLSEADIYTIEKFEVKTYSFRIYYKNDYRTEDRDALDYCNYLTYPINVADEYQAEDETGESLLDKVGYISYEAAVATIPHKPASVKREEAKKEAEQKKVQAKWDKMRQHKYIGVSLADFLKDWPNARLIDSASSGGSKVKIYRIYTNYELMFKNDICIAICNL